MRNLFISALLILQIISLSAIDSTAQTNIVQGRVIDQSGLPVGDVQVSIDGSDYLISDAEGKFTVTPGSELLMPFDVLIVKNGYKLKEFIFNESENKIEILVNKAKAVKEEETVVTIFDANNTVLKNTKVIVDGKSYTSDRKGNVSLKGTVTEKSTIVINGYEMSGVVFNEKEHAIKISADEKKVEHPAVGSSKEEVVVKEIKTPGKEEGVEAKVNTSKDTIVQVQLNEKVFKQYKGDFDELTNEIIAERIRVEGNNKKIRDEISAITDRLQNEKNLSKEQRAVLQKYLEKLETTLLENTIAFQKSQERTNFLIQKLKTIIMEKDSINIKAMKKIAVVEKESRKTERKFKRNIIVFSIITGALLLLAMVFYSIAIKMKKQRRELMKANEAMHGIKDELAKSIIELKGHKELLEEQKRQLDALR